MIAAKLRLPLLVAVALVALAGGAGANTALKLTRSPLFQQPGALRLLQQHTATGNLRPPRALKHHSARFLSRSVVAASQGRAKPLLGTHALEVLHHIALLNEHKSAHNKTKNSNNNNSNSAQHY